jgi:hypothetical protein
MQLYVIYTEGIKWAHNKEIVSDKQTTKFMALVRERTIPTERPPIVGEVSANICG